MILLGELRHLAPVIVDLGLLRHAVQQLLDVLRYAGGLAATATAAALATAAATAAGGLAAASALERIAAGVLQHGLVGVQHGAGPGSGDRIPLSAFLGQRNGFRRPLAGGDQRLYGLRRQVLHADQAGCQRGEIRHRRAGDHDEGGFVQTVKGGFSLSQRAGDHGADLIPVLQQRRGIEVAQVAGQVLDLAGRYGRARRDLLGRGDILVVGLDGLCRFLVVGSEGVADGDRAVLQILNGRCGALEVFRVGGLLRVPQLLAQRGHLL